jgi:hypothetical protein
MSLKFFTKKYSKSSIAVNPDKVICVTQHADGHAFIYSEGVDWEVTEPYLEVVARLNERD